MSTGQSGSADPSDFIFFALSRGGFFVNTFLAPAVFRLGTVELKSNRARVIAKLNTKISRMSVVHGKRSIPCAALGVH